MSDRSFVSFPQFWLPTSYRIISKMIYQAYNGTVEDTLVDKFIDKAQINNLSDEDLVAYYTDQTRSISPADPGETGFSEPSYFLNLGLSYLIEEGQEIRFDVWNALGWVDDKHNKRGSVKRVGTYRYEPAAVGLSFNLAF